MLGLLVFSLGFVTISLFMRIGVELYVNHTEKKSLPDVVASNRRQASVSQQAIARFYYNTKRSA